MRKSGYRFFARILRHDIGIDHVYEFGSTRSKLIVIYGAKSGTPEGAGLAEIDTLRLRNNRVMKYSSRIHALFDGAFRTHSHKIVRHNARLSAVMASGRKREAFIS
jgi:hypothetical protein